MLAWIRKASPFPVSTHVLFVFLKKALQIPLLNRCDLQTHAGEQQRRPHVSYFRKAGCIHELHACTHTRKTTKKIHKATLSLAAAKKLNVDTLVVQFIRTGWHFHIKRKDLQQCRENMWQSD